MSCPQLSHSFVNDWSSHCVQCVHLTYSLIPFRDETPIGCGECHFSLHSHGLGSAEMSHLSAIFFLGGTHIHGTGPSTGPLTGLVCRLRELDLA